RNGTRPTGSTGSAPHDAWPSPLGGEGSLGKRPCPEFASTEIVSGRTRTKPCSDRDTRMGPGMKHALTAVLIGFGGLPSSAAEPELVSVAMIWDKGRHNAFTDLVRFRDKWFCIFREADAHVGGNGTCRILTSTDGDTWSPSSLVEEKGIDLPDPKCSAPTYGRLMLVAGGSVYDRKTYKGRQPRVAFSSDGKT